MKTWCTLLIACLLWSAPARAQSGAPPPPPAAVMNDPVQGGWHGAELQEETGRWERIVQEHPADQQARLNLFRSARNASLARHGGAIPAPDHARLEDIAHDMARNDADGFETRIALFHLHFPQEAAWAHLEQAARTGTGRVELIGPQLAGAARSGDEAAMVRHGLDLVQRGGIAPALLAMADDILLSVAPDAVLIAAGEMDAYAVWTRQYASGSRRDVIAVDHRMLEDAAYRGLIWARAGARGATPSAETFVDQLARRTDRPVYCSLALGPERLARWSGQLYVTGLAARYSAVPFDNTTALAANWPRMHKALNAGPLSHNYLVPAAVLLKHYRAIGLEEGYAPLQHELRGMAHELGATEQLYRTGVLEH
ncbi:MAG: hypothetical protein RBT71_13460 [Flavobacteriales bacterium]|jgi:hypothetical protein|nr:hypothetical protein [Flavobacteriales bacterium]